MLDAGLRRGGVEARQPANVICARLRVEGRQPPEECLGGEERGNPAGERSSVGVEIHALRRSDAGALEQPLPARGVMGAEITQAGRSHGAAARGRCDDSGSEPRGLVAETKQAGGEAESKSGLLGQLASGHHLSEGVVEHLDRRRPSEHLGERALIELGEVTHRREPGLLEERANQRQIAQEHVGLGERVFERPGLLQPAESLAEVLGDGLRHAGGERLAGLVEGLGRRNGAQVEPRYALAQLLRRIGKHRGDSVFGPIRGEPLELGEEGGVERSDVTDRPRRGGEDLREIGLVHGASVQLCGASEGREGEGCFRASGAGVARLVKTGEAGRGARRCGPSSSDHVVVAVLGRRPTEQVLAAIHAEALVAPSD